LLFAFTTKYLYAEEKDQPAESPVAVTEPETLFFCGGCHILTYPRVLEKAFMSWKEGKHKDIGCVKCHYPPETLNNKIPQHEEIPKDKKAAQDWKKEMEFMKTELEVLARLTTVLNMKEAVVRKAPRIDDRSCTASQCHPSTGQGKEGEYWTKKIEYAKYEKKDKTELVVPFVHEVHFDKKKYVEGQEMHCTSCHQRETGERHFEVNREKCFLCHFKNLALNETRSKCSLCHEVPTKPLQTQKSEDDPDEEPITHKSLEEKEVLCVSCHLQLVRGSGEVREKNCLDCHDNDETVTKEVFNKKLMHERHVAAQNAHCFNCHEPMEHNEADYLDVAIEQCTVCHPGHHRYQKILLTGNGGHGVPTTPSQMFSVKTNCLSCHKEEKMADGEPVAHGSGKACVSCHKEKHEKMAKDWKETTDDELKGAREIEKEALDAIEKAKGKVPEKKLNEAMAMFKEGQENLYIVAYGGGVHNQKYAVKLLDEAMNRFEDAIDLLAGK
ncbi:MAG: hypothetical protein OEM19_06025, partial [Deltaproteobacteria bacterium]|nr:hypothetical protein [Deltaproteobacteria bacterium]